MSVASDRKSSKSGASKTSISVTLPPAQLDSTRSPDHALKVTSRKFSPSRNSPDLQHKYGRSVPTPENRNDFPETNHVPDTHSHRSGGTVPPAASPAPEHLTAQQKKQLLAVQVIENAWLSYRDRQMFKLLKHAVCAAEHSLTYEILRKVCPKEAEFLRDKALQIRVRFRFGGTEFPPMIFFKIFTSMSNGMGVKYISGKRMIQPASEAAKDACDLMGHRKFYDQMIQDAIHHETHGISDELDVTTLKDYMQYLSILDELPANKGGKENTWRKLTLSVLPRQSVFYDVVDFLYSKRLSPDLRKQLPLLLMQPLTAEAQRQHIEIISNFRSIDPPRPVSRTKLTNTQTTARRSKQAKLRALKMRRMYEQKDEDPEIDNQYVVNDTEVYLTQQFEEDIKDGDDWEEEADKLYEWTQELSFDEIAATPRLATAATVN